MALHPTRRSILAGATLAGLLPVAPGLAQEATGRAPVVGAGSTFAYPVVSRWAKGYHRWVAGGGTIPIAGGGLDDPPSGAMLDYEPTGSLAGIMRVKERAVDFGASEMPLKSDELRKLGLVQFPLRDRRHRGRGQHRRCRPGTASAHRPGPGRHLPRAGREVVRSVAQGAQSADRAAGRQDRRRPPFRRLGHDLQLHRLPQQGEPVVEGESRLRPAGDLAGRHHRRQGQ